MKHHPKVQTFLFFLLTVIATSCSKIADHNRFLKEHGITETNKIPADYTNGNGWKELAGDYVYYLGLFNMPTGTEMLYFVANKKENEMIGMMHVNPFIMTAAVAPGISPATVVTNYEEISRRDIDKANDMTEFNALLAAMPEMKDFEWKNKLQNQVASGIILKTHFIYVTKTKTDDPLFMFSETPVMQDHDKLLQDIFSGEYTLYHRDVQRLNQSVELGQYIKALGFTYETKGEGTIRHDNPTFYIQDLITKDPIDFKGKGKMFFFIPFKSFVRIQSKGETPVYSPAIETFEYTIKPDAGGFPVFSRHTHFASLLTNNGETTTTPFPPAPPRP
jgi:hypothetical protein